MLGSITETERLILREWAGDDAEQFDRHCNTKMVTQSLVN